MIKYLLGCENGHEFDGWFSSSDEFSRLKSDGHLDCPICASSKIEKLLMAPSLKKKANAGPVLPEIKPENLQSTSNPPPAKTALSKTSEQAVALPELPPQLAEAQEAFIEKVREFKKQVEANLENVGDKFGEEARKIHYGESEKRGIYGKADIEEVAELQDEGIEVLPLPDLPEDKN